MILGCIGVHIEQLFRLFHDFVVYIWNDDSNYGYDLHISLFHWINKQLNRLSFKTKLKSVSQGKRLKNSLKNGINLRSLYNSTCVPGIPHRGGVVFHRVVENHPPLALRARSCVRVCPCDPDWRGVCATSERSERGFSTGFSTVYQMPSVAIVSKSRQMVDEVRYSVLHYPYLLWMLRVSRLSL